ncbi:uncharacterized protein LOC128128382 [Lactuca sativa]|uniref:uncharacterized protein LOC128128382 n=1 Tax=Lactuca sativa TaxID=4236 RepID=UPI0022AF0344|nr:uncharacterized protein LOC128128382 [Lactuca sativa]
MFIKHSKSQIILAQVYVDDIIFGSTDEKLSLEFAEIMAMKFEMSMMANPKESHLLAVKRIFCYLKYTPNLGLWYPHDFVFKPVRYTDSDHGGCGIDRKSTSRGAQITGDRLVLKFGAVFRERDFVVQSGITSYLIWEAITIGPFIHSGTNRTVKTQKEYNQLLLEVEKIPQDEKDKLMCNLKALKMIRLKELYSTDEDLEHSIQTLLLSEFGVVAQKPEETLLQTFDRYNHLLSKMMKHGIEIKEIEQKVMFMNGLRPKWMAVVSTIKDHEQFKSYLLAKLMGILKSDESTVTKEVKVVSGMGSLALISKRMNVTEEEDESDLSECDLTSEEYAMMVSNSKKFARRKLPANKNRKWQGNYSSEKVKEEIKNVSQKDDDKKESKIAGDSGYDCNYCHSKNHFAKDCVLRKMENLDNDEFGGVEVWSTDSEDEEVTKPSHGRAYVAKEGVSSSAGKCMMVSTETPTEGEDNELNLKRDKCFAVKPVSETINDCDRLIKKEDEVIAECESITSSDEISVTYKYGLDKIETFIESKEHKSMLKNLLDENDRLKIKSETIRTFDSSNAKLCLDHKINVENTLEFNEDIDLCEISVEDVVDCSEFLKSETEKEATLISENSVAYARLSNDKSKKLKEKAMVYQKVQTVPNQVYAVTGLTGKQTTELKIMVDKDNAKGCDNYFWYTPIDNADETVGLSEQTSWRVKGRYVADPINKPSSFDKPSTSRTKEIPEEPGKKPEESKKTSNLYPNSTEFQKEKQKSSFNIHKSQHQLDEQKRERLQHNLISVSQLVVGTGLKVSFDDEGSEIIEKQSKIVLLKSERKGEMYPLNLSPIKGKPNICLLSKANSDESWLWHRRLSHLNFKDINNLVLGDHVRGLPLLKFDKEHLCAASEKDKQR